MSKYWKPAPAAQAKERDKMVAAKAEMPLDMQGHPCEYG
jgi:hypothetical protein